ncbi:DUF4303 domain-containing protein [Paenibacillus thalictri]|uniref:DUF4303 domain-containing protein n=1 Tax=Paenibacillus thalictri TaxID=2527873 RepID=UPI0013EF3226|nr:DUF4303 domain-containing protein [Paenibacillus thalictri]
MNTYYSKIGRLLDERTPIDQEGYFVLCDDNEAKFSLEKPEGIKIVTSECFANALAEGCKFVVNTFASSTDNDKVYVFNLYADEHNSIFIYLNTMDQFKGILERYQNKYPGKYQDISDKNSLKYSQGDFNFQFWHEHMGEHGRLIHDFERLAYLVMDLDEGESDLNEDDTPILAFEAGIIKDGYYLLALKATVQLINEKAFGPLNKTENFIAFASTGNDYMDYSLTMRKTIEQELFYDVFPNIKEKDAQYREELEKNAQLSVGEYLDYWNDAVHSGYRLDIPFKYIKSELEIFLQLERFGDELASECIDRLKQINYNVSLERKQFESIYFYIEALHFAGILSEEQKHNCSIVADLMSSCKNDLKEAAKELLNFARS